MMKKMRFLLLCGVASFLAMGAQGQEIERKKLSTLPERHVMNDSIKLIGQTDSLDNHKNYRFSLETLRDWLTDGSSAPVVSVSASVTPTSVFTVTVTNPTTTPLITISMKAASAYTVLGNNTGSSAVPGYMSLTLASAMFANQGQTNYVLHGHASGNPSWGLVSLTNDVSGVLAAPNGGTDQSSYAVGDFLYASGTTALSKLGIGTSGYVLKVSGGLPVWAAESVTETNAITFTNKRYTMRTTTVTTVSATPSINTDNQDIYVISAQAVNITNMSTNLTGTPVVGDVLELIITGTGAGTISWGSSFVDGDFVLPTAFGTTTKIIVVQYLTTSFGTTKWTCVRS